MSETITYIELYTFIFNNFVKNSYTHGITRKPSELPYLLKKSGNNVIPQLTWLVTLFPEIFQGISKLHKKLSELPY